MKIILYYTNKYFAKPIWSFIINLIYWIFHIFKLPKILDKKNKIGNSVLSIEDIRGVLNNFTWTKDKLKDWTPWVITLLNNNYKDDCDGAAVLGKWLLSLINIESSIKSLYGNKKGHAVCISNDKKYMISNNNIVILKTADWKTEVLKYFENVYSIII